MTTYKTLLEETLEAWEEARNGFIAEVQNIPEDKFDFRPTAEVRSVKELVIHILEVAMMMTGELTRPDTNLRRAPWPDLLEMYASEVYAMETKDELLGLLNTQFQDAQQQFLQTGDLHMLQLIERFDGEKGTRLAWLQHGIAQEMYHRGQLTLYERLLGIEPALTQQIKGS